MTEQASIVPPRLNGVIQTLESGAPAFVAFSPPGVDNGFAIAESPYDGVVFEMEHNPFNAGELRITLQSMLNRRQIAQSGSVAPKVTPFVRIPPNGSDMNTWVAKQVLDAGVYGVIWPHVSTVEEARNAVSACRYSSPPSSPRYEPHGTRGDGPSHAARYWGLTQQEYYARADVWPLDPQGEIMVVVMVEDAKAIKNLPRILDEVKGISAVLIGEGDLSQDLGYPRQYEHPTLVSALAEVLAICKSYNIVCGHPHVTTKNVEQLVEQGYRWLMAAPVRTYTAVEMGRRAASAVLA